MRELQEQALAVANRHIIERPRLTRLLDETTARVILLVAPAGYGKTVLAQQWLARQPHGWLRATAPTADVASLGIKLLDAAANVTPSIGSRFRQWLHVRGGSESSELAAQFLVEDLRPWPDGALLAIDDYQFLTREMETVVARLREIPTMRILITTRRLPSWCRSRDLLYGEIAQVDAETLAMSSDEATAVLSALEPRVAQDLIALAAGWPAVIGLASFVPEHEFRKHLNLPPALHAYIAEELYASLSEETRADLAQLSLLPSITESLARLLLGDNADSAVSEGLRVGFLTDDHAGAYVIHPLLREFLRQKVLEFDSESRTGLLGSVVQILLRERAWEAALELIREFQLDVFIEQMIASSLYELLAQGQLAIISQLVRWGRERTPQCPLVDLAAAELCFREGFHERALPLAVSAAKNLGDNGEFTSKAFCRAGNAAYLAEAIDTAAVNFGRARATARAVDDERKAVWGQFLAALEQEDESAVTLLDEFERLAGSAAEDLVRIQNGRLHVGMRIGSVAVGLRTAETVSNIVDDVRDPVVRTSFWHVYSNALRLAARYEEGLAMTQRAMQEIQEFDLGFARPHVHLTRAAIQMTLSLYGDAYSELDEALRIASQTGDVYTQLSERLHRCRLNLLLGQFDEAVRCTSGSWPDNISMGLLGELAAYRAIAITSAGDADNVQSLLDAVDQTTKENEAQSLGACARALLALNSNSANASALIVPAFEEALPKSILDPFVFAFKFDRRLPRMVQRVPALRAAVRDLLPFVGTGQAPTGALAHLPSTQPPEGLTRRECEVLDLIAAGRTNSEIASELFLSVPTVKVHVRSILRKLGLRTRTQAAVFAITTLRREAVEEVRLPRSLDDEG